MKINKTVQVGPYVSPYCEISPLEVQGVLCSSTNYGSSTEGFDENEVDYNWGA